MRANRTARAMTAGVIALLGTAMVEIHPAAAAIGSWRTTTSMHVTREHGGAGNGNSSAVLPDGRVLIAGGFDSRRTADMFTFAIPSAYLSSAEIYDPATARWSATGSMHESRFAPIITTLRTGKVLVAGGFGGGIGVPRGTFRSSAELYDPATGTWSATGDMHECRAGATSSMLSSGKVLVVGGVGCHARSEASAEIYDPATGRWAPASKMRAARTAHTATTLNDGRILVAGGRDTNGAVEFIHGTTEIYDPATNRWVPGGAMKVARTFHSAGLLPDGQVIVAGGRCPGQYVVGPPGPTACSTKTAELYNPVTNTWTTTASMHAAREFSGNLVLPGSKGVPGGFFVAGGGQKRSSELFSPVTHTWSLAGDMSQVHDDAQLVLLRNGDLLIAGGFRLVMPRYTTTATAELFRLAEARGSQ